MGKWLLYAVICANLHLIITGGGSKDQSTSIESAAFGVTGHGVKRAA